jgi:hypothetical protein
MNVFLNLFHHLRDSSLSISIVITARQPHIVTNTCLRVSRLRPASLTSPRSH